MPRHARTEARLSWLLAFVIVVALSSSSCTEGQHQEPLKPARSLNELVTRYYKALSAGDEKAACAMTDPKAMRKFERQEHTTCEKTLAALIETWGPKTRKLVGRIEVGGDPAYVEEMGGWSALDPLAPLIIDLPDTEVRSLLGDEFAAYDRTDRLAAIARRSKTSDPDTVFDFAFDSPATYSFFDHVQALNLEADDLNAFSENGDDEDATNISAISEQDPNWLITNVDGHKWIH